MSLMQTVMTTIAKYLPDRDADPLLDGPGLVGQPVNRVDGPLKVMAEATFSAEYKVTNLAYAALAHSPIAKGRILAMNTQAASQAPGVLAVITYLNAPPRPDPLTLDSTGNGTSGAAGSSHPVLSGPEIRFSGEAVAVVVAETQEQADHAVTLLDITYEEEPAATDFELELEGARAPKAIMGQPPRLEIGDAEVALAQAAFKVDHEYTTPRHNHTAIEPHASISFWSEDRDSLVAFEGSQMNHGFRATLAHAFGLEESKVRVLSPFVGGAFGSKALWSNSLLCALASREVGRPVKLALSREGVFRLVGGRTPSAQRVALGADEEGRFVSLVHTGVTATTPFNDFAEQFTFPARHNYASKNILVDQKIVYLDTVANTFMRAPGESIGGFALESAIDELAHEMGIDPIELRRRNEPQSGPTGGNPVSQRDLLLAYQRGAEKFGWRPGPPRSRREGDWLIGQGVATAYYPYYRMPASARLHFRADGRVVVATAAHEMGMGTATVQIQHAAQRLGLPREMVSFEYGDSDLPPAPMAGGSNQTASLVAAVTAAVDMAHQELLDRTTADSPLAIATLDEVEARAGGLYLRSDPSQGESYVEILRKAGETELTVEAAAPAPLELMKYAMGSYGAQFSEVRVRESTGEVRVSRFLGSFDVGRVLNAKTAASQLRGGIVMGIGAALMEETLFDPRLGRIMNPSMADYHVPVQLDVPQIEILVNNIPDPLAPLGLRGVGEIGITGVAASIANAVFNATGKRVRDLPITLDKLL